MDIILQTNTDNPFLAFQCIERFDDGSGYATTLAIRSGWISAEYKFSFESHVLLEFLNNLEQINRTLIGIARLKPVFEDQFIEFRGDTMGHLLIQGDLFEHGHMEQHLRFAFATDQTCLRPFIDALRHVAR